MADIQKNDEITKKVDEKNSNKKSNVKKENKKNNVNQKEKSSKG